MRRLLALTAVAIVASSCGGDDEVTRTVTVTEAITTTVATTVTATETAPLPPGAWGGLPQPLPDDGILPVDEFNAYAESVEEPWERDLAATASEYVGREASEATSVSFQATSGPEGGGPTNATLTLDGLLDDSVRARRYDLTLSRRQDGTWRIDSASWSQRCQQGRGHQSFTPEPCV